MTLDKSKFNLNPYYDDFDEAKKFLQVLFKPGYSVQARELTQLQTILSNQIGRMADHIFENGDVIQGAGITERSVVWFRLDNTPTSDNMTMAIDDLIGYDLYYDHTVLNTNSGGEDGEAGTSTRIVGKVLHTLEATAGDPYRIVFVEVTKDTKDESVPFPINQTEISCSNPNINVNLSVLNGADTTGTSDTLDAAGARGTAILVSIEQGLFYVDGYFVMNDAQTIPIFETVSDIRVFTPADRTVSVGFSIERDIETANTDTSLRDPSQGSYNYNAPGGDRFLINLKIKQIPYIFDELGYRTVFDTENYFEWARIIKGQTFKKLKYPEYAQLEETLARRTYDESGHYTVVPFDFKPEKYDEVWDPLTGDAGNPRPDHYNYCACGIETGKAYVRGYEFELQNTEHLLGKKARTTKTVNDAVVDIDVGNYVLVEHNFDGVEPLFRSDGAMVDNTMNLVGGSPEPEYKKINLSFVGANGEMIPVGCARIVQIALHSIDEGPTNVGSLYRIYLSDVVFGTAAGFDASSDLLTMKDVIFISDPISGKKLFNLYIPDGQEQNDGIEDKRQQQLIFKLPGGGAIKEVTGLDYHIQRDFELNFTDGDSDGVWTATASSPPNTEFLGSNNNDGVLDDLANTQEYIVSIDGYLFDMSPNSTGTYGGNSVAMQGGNQSVELRLTPPAGTSWTGTKKGYLVTTLRINADDEVIGNKEQTIRKKVLKRKTITITNTSNADGSPTMWNSRIENGWGINLGYPDVLRLEKVEGIGDGKDYTNDFDFYNGQNLNLYDHAYMHLETGFVGGTAGIQGAWTDPGAGFKCTFLYFDHQTWGDGDDHTDYSTLKYPLVANSYVHGDHEITEFENGDGITANFGGTSDAGSHGYHTPASLATFGMIPPFIDKTGKGGINLNDALDFRPIKVGKWDENHSEYGKIRGVWTPLDGRLSYADFVHYIGRIDTLVLTRNREFKLLTGIPAAEPQVPTHDPENEMAIFNLSWPAFTYSCDDISAEVIDNQRYTMSDIGKLDERITELEETSEESELENEGKQEATQYGTQFTNVIQTDNFENIISSDIMAKEYSVSINPAEGYIRPAHSDMNVNLFKHSLRTSSDGITSSSDNLWYLTPSANPVSTVSNLTGNTAIYPNPFSKTNWMGDLKMSPSGDDWFAMHKTSKRVKRKKTYYVTKTVPGKAVGYPGHALANYHGKGKYLHKFFPRGNVAGAASTIPSGFGSWAVYQSKRDAWVRQYSASKWPFSGWQKQTKGYKMCHTAYGCIHKWNAKRTYKNKKKRIKKTKTIWKTISKSIKERVRPKEITLTATHMKPNTRFWVFIDGKRLGENTQKSWGYIVSGSSTMRTDAQGNASVKIQIPKDNPHHEGDLLIRLCDNKLNVASLTTTCAEAFFVIGGVGKQSYANIKSTRPIRAKRDTVTKERIVQDASTFSKGQLLTDVADYFDPLAQIFEIDEEAYGSGIFATSIDLFFREIDGDQLDDNNTGDPLPFSVELRPLLNDQPHPTTAVPLSFTTMSTGMLSNKQGPNISKHSRFTFASPVYLTAGRYALICKTNSTNYALWGTQYGSAGISHDGTSTQSDVEKQPYVGNLYLPQNNGSRWKNTQQSIMFRLNRAKFPTGTTPVLYLEGATADAINQHGFTVGTPDFHEVTILSQDMVIPNTEIKYYLNTDSGEQKELQPFLDMELPTRNTFDLPNQFVDPEQRALHEATLTTSDENLTPIVDMDRLSTVLTRLEFSNSTENELIAKSPIIYETPVARYIAKVINCGHEANIVRLSFDAARKEGTSFKCYTRCSTVDDTSIFDKPWVEMDEEITNAAMPSDTDEYYQQRFYYVKGVGFTDFQVKIVLTGDPLVSKWSQISKLKSFALYDPTKDTTIDGVGEEYAAEGNYTDEETGGEG